MKRGFMFIVPAVLMLVSVTQAQRTGVGFGRGGGLVQLAGIPEVQQDIGASEEQQGKLREVLEAYRQDRAKLPRLSREDLQNLTGEERRKKFQEMREASTKLQAQFKEKLAAVLEKNQIERLDQIRLQALGAAAYQDAAVVKALSITEDQQEKLRGIPREVIQEFRNSGERPTREAMAKIMAKIGEKTKAALTDDQREKFKKLVGKPFDVSKLQGRRRPPKPDTE